MRFSGSKLSAAAFAFLISIPMPTVRYKALDMMAGGDGYLTEVELQRTIAMRITVFANYPIVSLTLESNRLVATASAEFFHPPLLRPDVMDLKEHVARLSVREIPRNLRELAVLNGYHIVCRGLQVEGDYIFPRTLKEFHLFVFLDNVGDFRLTGTNCSVTAQYRKEGWMLLDEVAPTVRILDTIYGPYPLVPTSTFPLQSAQATVPDRFSRSGTTDPKGSTGRFVSHPW